MGNYTNQDCLNEIQKVSTAKLSIKTAIESKGVTVPADTTFAGYAELIENIPQGKPEETLTQTITENGSHVFNPSEGHVFSSASITVDVPDPVLGTLNVNPTTSEQNITAQAEGYEGFSEVNVSAVTSSIDSNITAENIKKDVTILGVTGTLEGSGKDYRYMNGTPDVEGLTAIGWTADDIGYYGANTSPHYAWENDNYKLSQENINLYSQNDPKPSLYKNNRNVTFVPNKGMYSYFGMGSAFRDMYYIKGIPWYNTSSLTSMYDMFRGCSSLQYIPQLNTSNVTNMGSMFSGCTSLTSIPPLDTSKVDDMTYMFENCSSLTSIPQLDTSKVYNMKGIFSGCTSLTSIPPLDTSNITYTEGMDYMFANCNSLQRVDGIYLNPLSSYTRSFFGDSSTSLSKLTHFIVNGSINTSLNGTDYFYKTPNLDYESIKSILEAMSRVAKDYSREMQFRSTITDQNGELAGLVSACTAKGWTIKGLTIK